MSKTRRQRIEEMLATEPGDTFLRYALAMEFASEGQLEEAVDRLRALIRDVPHYVPAYFQAAQCTLRNGDSDSAAELLRGGIITARAQSDMHAVDEMSALLAEIGNS